MDTVSAFANTDGGLIVLGLDEGAGFSVLDVDARKLASDLASTCADQLDPPIRPEIALAEIDERMIVAAAVDEPTHQESPAP